MKRGFSIAFCTFLIGMLTFPAFSYQRNVSKISYRYLSSRVFEVTISVSRNCENDSAVFLNSDVYVQHAVSGTKVNFSPTLKTIEIASPYCFSAIPGCGDPNTPSIGTGQEIITFKDTLDFNKGDLSSLISSSCDIRVVTEGKRDSSHLAGVNSYVFTSWNVCTEKKNSVQISDDFIGYAYFNKPLRFSPFFQKPDLADSLVIELVDALSTSTSTSAYKSGYSGSKPFTFFCIPNTSCSPKPKNNPPEGLYFNSVSGQLIALPVSKGQLASIALKYTWYRANGNGVYQQVGVMQTETNLEIIDGGTNTPKVVVQGSTDVTPVVYFETGVEKCVDVTITDLDNGGTNPADTNRLVWSGNVANASFHWKDSTEVSKTGKFCFKPNLNQLSNQSLITAFKAFDSNCILNQIGATSVQLLIDSTQIRGKINTVEKCQDITISYEDKTSKFLPLNYQWLVDGQFVSGSKQFDLKYDKEGKHYLSLRVSSDILADTLYLTDSFEVKSIIRVEILGDSVYCANESVKLTVNASGGDGQYTYSWSDGSTADSLAFVASKGDTLQLVLEDGIGCQISDNLKFRIATAVLEMPLDTVNCGNEQAFVWEARPFDGAWVGELGNLLVVNPNELLPGNHYFTFEYKDAFDCEYADSARVSIKAAPKMPLRDTAICSGDTMTLDYNGAGAWSGPGVINNQFISFGINTGVYTLFYNEENNVNCVLADSIKVTINELPFLNLQPVSSVCKNGSPVEINVTPASAILSGDGVNGGFFTPNQDMGPESEITASRTSEKGCVQVKKVKVDLLATPRAAFSSDKQSGSFPLEVNFDNKTEGGGDWNWNFGDVGSGTQNKSTDKHPTHEYNFEGEYDVTLIAIDPFTGCSDTLVKVGFISPVNSIHTTSTTALKAFPNPFNNEIILSIDAGKIQRVQVFNMFGEEMISEQSYGAVWQMNTSHFASGIYYLNVFTSNGDYMVKIVKP